MRYKKQYERAGDIIELRNDGKTFEEIAKIYHLTRQRTHQIYNYFVDKSREKAVDK